MKQLLMTTLLSCAITLPAMAALRPGDAAPDFKAPAALAGQGIEYTLKDALKKGPVVVYFFPSAYGGGCSVQAHAFAERHGQFLAAGASIIGVSLDTLARLKEFSADPDYCAGKIAVASDGDGKITRAYDLQTTAAEAGRKDIRGKESNHDRVERTTFIVTPDGKIAATLGDLAPTANVDKALETVQQLAARRPAAPKP